MLNSQSHEKNHVSYKSLMRFQVNIKSLEQKIQVYQTQSCTRIQ